MSNDLINQAKEKFGKIIEEQLQRVEKMKSPAQIADYSKISPVIIGICWGDGIGEIISKHAQKLLEHVLKDEVKEGKIEFKEIKGLTIENRAAQKKAIPEDVLEEIKSCHVILKGPTTTPQAGDKWPNIESANVAMRRYLDLFANVRPVRIPHEGIDWCFFRENTEGAYVLGSKGFDASEDLSIDFKVITEQGAERIIRMAFEYAKKNSIDRVTVVTKSNVVKTTDGRFSRVAFRLAKEYPNIKLDEWYIDIMTAKLIDPARRKDFKVIVLPNLYGDILTDEAAQMQGGVGTAGSANIGHQWSMFEAIHGSAPRMVKEGRAKFADPCSMIRASAMLLKHIGFIERSEKVEMALDVCGQFEKKMQITGRDSGVTGEKYTNYLLSGYQEILTDPSYKGQIVTMTYPLIGNYGINEEDVESRRPFVEGFIVKECSRIASNWRSKKTLHDYLKENNIVGIDGVDTRAITRHTREQGAMRAVISTEDLDEKSLLKKVKASQGLVGIDLVKDVTCDKIWQYNQDGQIKVVVIDCGVKLNILRSLASRGCQVTVVPAQTKPEEILKFNPDGIMLSNGPGDPAAVVYVVQTIKKLLGKLPMFGICLGQQMLCLALGGKTYKLKFGHHGGNQPAKDLKTGKIDITVQNHGFCVDIDSLNKDEIEITHVNLNDNTLEGIKHKKLPAFSVQFHPESCPGPHDSQYLFDRFVELIKQEKNKLAAKK